MGERWPAVAALLDQVRRALYDYVRRQDHPVSREEAASSQAISRGLAAFHLDKLVDVGLLQARTDQPGHRRGRGRRPKVYEPIGDGLAFTIPQRRYELLGEILADAAADSPPQQQAVIMHQARRHGAELGAAAVADAELRGEPVSGDPVGALQALGFEPELVDSKVVLRNCPFHALVADHTALVCGMNRDLLAAAAHATRAGLAARLEPQPGRCCVVLGPALAGGAAAG